MRALGPRRRALRWPLLYSAGVFGRLDRGGGWFSLRERGGEVRTCWIDVGSTSCWAGRPAGPRSVRSAGPAAQSDDDARARGAVYAAVDARLYRIRRDGDRLTRDPRPLILPAQVQEGWQHPSGRYFYLASSDQRTSTARVRHHYLNAFEVDASGGLHPLGNAVELAHRPIYITVDRRGEHVISAFSFRPELAGGAPPRGRRVEAPRRSSSRPASDAGYYAHAVYVLPSNRSVLLVARGNEPEPAVHTEDPGGLYVYEFENGRLTGRQTVAPNGGLDYRARHADFHPSGRWVYVDLETQNLLHTYAIGEDDTLSEEPLFVSTTLAAPEAYRGGQTTSSIRMHPTNGRTLYVANRGRGTETFQGERVANGTENTISVFDVDPHTGEPTLIQTADTHSIAVRTMAFAPDGRSMVAANTAPGYVRVDDRLESVPATLTLYDIEADGRLTFKSTLPVETRGETMFWCGVVRY